MSLAERLTQVPARCKLGDLIELLADEDRAALEAALAAEWMTAAHITRALNDEGFDIGNTTVKEHRNGVCLCARRNRG